MPGGDYASGPVVRLHRQRVWIWITEWIEQDEGNTSGMQLVPFDTCQVRENEDGAVRLPAKHVVDPGRVRVLAIAAFGGDDVQISRQCRLATERPPSAGILDGIEFYGQ